MGKGYEVVLSSQAEDEIMQLAKNGELAVVVKIHKIILQLQIDPRLGIGKPKQLKGDLKGLYSRRLSDKHRMVYLVDDDKVLVLIVQVKGHYDDK